MAPCKAHAILLLLVAVVRMSVCNAQKNNSALVLEKFTVTKAEPPQYKFNTTTTVTFDASLTNSGPWNLTNTSRTVCVLFFDISTESKPIRNVGQVYLALPDYLGAGQTYQLERETVYITIEEDPCPGGNKSERRELCAGIKADGSINADPYCVEFKDIDEGGVGEIDCEESDSPFPIVLPIGLAVLLVAVVVFGLVCWKRRREQTDIVPSRKADPRDRFKSLPHIYDDPTAIEVESPYDSTIPKSGGSSNAAYQEENEPESPYFTSLPVDADDERTPELKDLLRKRPSQANVYTLEESPFSTRPTVMAHSWDPAKTVQLEGVTHDDSATDRKSIVFTDLVEQSHETAVDAAPRSVEMTHVADFPQRAAPEPHQEWEPAGVPNLDQCPSRLCPVLEANDNENPDQSKTEGTTEYLDDPYLPPKPKPEVRDVEQLRPRSIHDDRDNAKPPRPPRPLIDEPNKPARPARKTSTDLDQGVLKDAIARAVREHSTVRPTSGGKNPNTLLADNNETDAQMLDPTDSEFLDVVMQNYLSLVYEMSKGEEEYKSSMKRDLERIDSNTLTVEPQVEYRRKSLSAQLTLNLARNTKRESEIYVNQWNKSWEFKRSNLEVDLTTPLGEGQFGKVYKGRATMVKGQSCNMEVAVKVLKDDAGNDAKDEFLKELAIHTILKPNPHVVQLIGCCIRDDPIFIITEYLSGGNLLKYLRERPSHLTGRASVQHYVAKFGLQIARGMDYVAKMKIVHRDLAARNILVSEYEECKVADFGFARDIFGLAYYPKSPERAPIRWYAPEAILDDMFSTKSDVWSFGILLFEIATLGKVAPYHGMDNNQVRFSVSSASHPSRPLNCDDKLFKLMTICWDKDPEKRPTFHELVVLFEGIQGDYPEPKQADPGPVDPNSRPELSPKPKTVKFKPDLPSMVNNNSIPEIRVDQESEIVPDPPAGVDSVPLPEVDTVPDSQVNSNSDPEVDPDPRAGVDSGPLPEVNTVPDSQVNPNSDPEVEHEPLAEVSTDDVSPAESETDEEEAF